MIEFYLSFLNQKLNEVLNKFKLSYKKYNWKSLGQKLTMNQIIIVRMSYNLDDSKDVMTKKIDRI